MEEKNKKQSADQVVKEIKTSYFHQNLAPDKKHLQIVFVSV